MTDSTLNRFLSSGTNAERLAFTPAPPSPGSGPDPTYIWFETDTGDTFAWDYDGAAWEQVNTATGSAWGAITGTLSDQTDLQAELDDKADLAGATFTGDVIVPDDAYDATGWNGNNEAPTKNAIRDKFESLSGTVFATGAELRTGTETAKALSPDTVFDAATYVALNDSGGNIAVDLASGFNFTMTMDGDYTLSAPSNGKPGQTGCIVLTQDGTGTQTLAYNAAWKFAGGIDPVLSTAASTVDILFYQVLPNGTDVFANLVKGVA